MLAIHEYVGHIGLGYASAIEDVARKILACGLQEDGYVVNAAIRNLCGERKAGVAGYEEVVADVVLDFNGIARAGNEAYDRAANREGGLGTNDLHIADRAVGGAAAVQHGACLPRARGLRKNRYGVR